MHRHLRLFSLLFCLSCIITSVSLAAEDASPPTSPETASQPLPAKTVTAIQVKGNKAISTNTIISKMKTRIGSPYQENVVSDDLKRLYLLGYFSDIKIDAEDYKDGLRVVVTVSERPLVERINFSGIHRITTKDEKLKEQLKSREGQYLDYPKLDEDVRTFKKMYERLGFNQAQITYNVAVSKETGKARVEFLISENKKVRINKIIIEGNASFKRAQILRLLKTKQAWFFNAGVMKEDVLREDLERLKAFYRRNGFSDVKAESSVAADKERPYLLSVTFKLEEGKRYLVGNVLVRGNAQLSEKEILSRLKDATPGKVFSDDALRQDAAAIQGLYFDKGYISVQVQETTFVNPGTGRVDISYAVTENQIAYVDKIKVRGNIKTKDIVIRRELRIRPGDKFDGEKLRRSKERLDNLGFFEEISYDTEDTAAGDKKNLVVEVKESKTGAFSFGGGYSTVDQFVGFVEIEQKNFDWRNWPYFTGGGQNMLFRGSFGTVSGGFELSFTEPWLFDYPVAFGFDGYQRSHKRDTSLGYGYDEKITGGDLRLGKDFLEYLRGDIVYRMESIKISNIADNSPEIEKERGINLVSSLTPTLTYDSRNNIYDTKRGDLFTGSVQWAGLGGDKRFWKFISRGSHFFPLLRNSVLEARLRVGIGSTYGSTERIPIYERYFSGGASTIRGYEERKVGPVDSSNEPVGGDSMFIGNLEYTYPLFDFLKLAAFFDTGNVWSKTGKMFSTKLKSGLGIGVRLKSPIGPIMLDYGIPLDKEPGETKRKSGRFHFSASHGF
jgi:outer membrane protein insertion porin family